MKRIVSLLLAAILCFSMLALTACGGDPVDDGVMSYEEFMAAPVDSVCTVETNLQAWQGWWDNKLPAPRCKPSRMRSKRHPRCPGSKR